MTTSLHRRTDIERTDRRREHRREPIVRWGAVFAGAVIAIGLLFLLNSFWEALAFSSDISYFRDTLNWWRAIDSIVVLAVAGFLAGWLARTPGWGAGLLNGIAAWGLLIAGSVVVGVNSNIATTSLANAGAGITRPEPGSLWPTFAAYAIGVLAAAAGGVLGGTLPRPDFMYESFETASTGTIDLRDEPMAQRSLAEEPLPPRRVVEEDEPRLAEGRRTTTTRVAPTATERDTHMDTF